MPTLGSFGQTVTILKGEDYMLTVLHHMFVETLAGEFLYLTCEEYDLFKERHERCLHMTEEEMMFSYKEHKIIALSSRNFFYLTQEEYITVFARATKQDRGKEETTTISYVKD